MADKARPSRTPIVRILTVRILPLFLIALLHSTSAQAQLPLAMGSGVHLSSSGTALAEWVYTLQKGDSVQQLVTQLLYVLLLFCVFT